MATLFLTGRRKINRGDIKINARPRGEHAEFSAELSLARYRLPDDSRVFVEAYTNVAMQRFDFGTKEQPYARESTELTQFEASDRPQFRIKVVGNDEAGAQLLAGIEHLRADWGDEEGGKSWLQVVPKRNAEMMGELWRVERPYGPDWQLWVNRDAGQLYNQVNGHDALVCGLIMPAAFRMVLERDISESGGHADTDTPWMRQATRLAGRAFPVSNDGDDGDGQGLDVRQWVTEAATAFAREQMFSTRLTQITEHDGA